MNNISKKLLVLYTSTYYFFSTCNASEIGNYFRNFTAKDIDPTSLRDTIFYILTTIGIVAAAIVIMLVAIQFLTANAQKKALLKEKLWLIAIGVFILAGGFPLYEIIRSIVLDFRDIL